MSKLDQKYIQLTSEVRKEARMAFFLMETKEGRDLHFFLRGNLMEIKLAMLALAKSDDELNRILREVVNEMNYKPIK